MNGGSRIVGLRPASEAEMVQDFGSSVEHGAAGEIESWLGPEVADIEPEPRAPRWVLPTMGVIASVAWLGAMLWLSRGAFPMAPVALAQFIAALCVPPTLIAVLCLLALRTSRAEAQRFGATARAMRAEADALEQSISALAMRLDANRRALTEQAQQLSHMGDATAERLRAIESEMSAEAQILQTICGTLNKTADETRSSLAVVFDSLPKAHSETASITAQLNAVGLAASERAGELSGTLATLAERGRIADEVASGAAARLAAHITRMESTTEVAASRLDGAAGEMSEAIDAVLERAAHAIEEARKGIAAQGEAMLAMLGASQAAMEKSGRDGAEALQARLASVEETVERITTRLSDEQARSDNLFATLSLGVEGANDQFDRLHGFGVAKSQELAAAISALTSSAQAMDETMRVGTGSARTLITTAEDLLTALDASAREIDETLPEALARLESRISVSRQIVGAAKPELLALVQAAESTHDAVGAVAGLVTSEREKLEHITATLTEALDVGQDKAQTMDAVVGEAIDRARSFAEDAGPQLIEVLSRIRETAGKAADSARDVLGSVIPEAARKIETASADAVKLAFDRALPQPLAELAEASEAAVAAATRASEHLSQQLMTISESTATIEARIEEERADRDEYNKDNFARRVSLLIEALNSSSIDITKTFSHEVADSAWSAYLKGDRGVFTRRAVRLLDNQQAREIARMHDEDSIFRNHVNRYIHDFEGMLRQILTLRDGSALAVTLLSSDMGKLYVALAQAIERLRT